MKTMKFLILYPLLSVFLSASCGNTKETTKSTNNAPTAQSETAAPAPNNNQTADEIAMTFEKNAAESQNQNYRLIVSFISIGEGVDPKGREMLDNRVNSWNGEKGERIQMETVPWGREGEADFCFTLKELSPKEQEAFVKEIKSMYQDNKLVQISENQPCIHKR